MQLYLPDNCNLSHLPKSFVFTLIKTIAPDTWADLKTMVEIRKRNNTFRNYDNNVVIVEDDVCTEIIAQPNQEVIEFIKNSSLIMCKLSRLS